MNGDYPVKTDNRGMIRQTVYMPPGVYEAIREAAYVRYLSQQAVWREAMSFYLAEKIGVGTWDELDNRKQKQTAQRQLATEFDD